jgi:hypothetical protein
MELKLTGQACVHGSILPARCTLVGAQKKATGEGGFVNAFKEKTSLDSQFIDRCLIGKFS